jgi:uncharacterized repeat protein (TIGR03803 family)
MNKATLVMKVTQVLTRARLAPAGQTVFSNRLECRNRSRRCSRRFGPLRLLCALAAIPMAQAQTAPWNETVLRSFGNFAPKGTAPQGGVIRDAAGNLYGTAAAGGAGGVGTVYKVTPEGVQTVLHSFTGGADGGVPQGNLIADSEGNLYGTTEIGGTANAGVVYQVNLKRQETVLYSFTGGADGALPVAGLIRDPAGNLYGTTLFGGSDGAGVVFKLDTSGNLTVLYTFTGGADGGYPVCALVRDAAGNLNGTTAGGGTANAGVVFELDATGQESVLYNFTGGADGGDPLAGVIGDSSGNFYGTTSGGGNLSGCNGSGCGVAYKVDRAGKETVLYTFSGAADGARPIAGVIRDAAGNLYGTAANGGDLISACYNGNNGCGVVYKLDQSGNETVLHAFTDAAGTLTEGETVKIKEGMIFDVTETNKS